MQEFHPCCRRSRAAPRRPGGVYLCTAGLWYNLLMNMNVEAEIRDLKRRVSDIEASFGYLTQQLSGVHKDLLADQASTEEGFHQVDRHLDGIDGRLHRLDEGLSELRTHLPKMLGDAIRDALADKPRSKG